MTALLAITAGLSAFTIAQDFSRESLAAAGLITATAQSATSTRRRHADQVANRIYTAAVHGYRIWNELADLNHEPDLLRLLQAGTTGSRHR